MRPGLLAFREGRLSLEALQALDTRPDLIFVDGHGTVHERGLGLASHLGVLLGIPSIGVPKTPFHAIDHAPGPERGSFYVLTKEWGAEGAAMRLRTGVKPVYVSPGHLVDLESAIRLCLAWSTGHHKVPEPLQAAHTLSASSRSAAVSSGEKRAPWHVTLRAPPHAACGYNVSGERPERGVGECGCSSTGSSPRSRSWSRS